jgi:hypothetical protein
VIDSIDPGGVLVIAVALLGIVTGHVVGWAICRHDQRKAGVHRRGAQGGVAVEDLMCVADAVAEPPTLPPTCSESWTDEVKPGLMQPHDCALIGGHRIHRCACGATLVPDVCCDMHNRNCEPPSELCCWRCTEAAHDNFPVPHADGSACVLADARETRETLGQQTTYDPDVMVPYGVAGQVHHRCREARKQAATDLICPSCSVVFWRVGSA